jgi:hypothetical protein
MPQMTDPFAALESFQEILTNDGMPLQQGIRTHQACRLDVRATQECCRGCGHAAG